MKPLLSAIAAALILISAQGVAEQTTQPVVTSCANVVVQHNPVAGYRAKIVS